MKAIREGIYRFNGEIEHPSESPLVSVHALYRHLGPRKVLSQNGSYMENLQSLVADSKDRNIFLFEESTREGIPISLAKMFSEWRDSTRGIYIIPTKVGDSTPKEVSWNNITDFIKSFSKSTEIMGGYFARNSPGKRSTALSGCGGKAYHKFKDSGIEVTINKDCCFTF